MENESPEEKKKRLGRDRQRRYRARLAEDGEEEVEWLPGAMPGGGAGPRPRPRRAATNRTYCEQDDDEDDDRPHRPSPPPTPPRPLFTERKEDCGGGGTGSPPAPARGRRKGESVGLVMECYDMELSPEQKEHRNSIERDFKAFQEKYHSLVTNREVLVEQGNYCTFLDYYSSGPPVVLPRPQLVVPATPTSNSSLLVQSNTGQNNYQIVMDGRMGVIVTPPATSNAMANNTVGAPTTNAVITPVRGRGQVATRGKKAKLLIPVSHHQQQPQQGQGVLVSVSRNTMVMPDQPGRMSRGGGQGGKGRPHATPSVLVVPPTSTTNTTSTISSTGNTNEESNPAVVDLTEEDGNSCGGGVASDSREVAISKMTGKTYPSLVVVARPNLHAKDYPPSQSQGERIALDAKVKKVLMVASSTFTEWLLQRGLLKCEQVCGKHLTSEGKPVRLKLGMYSDSSKFPYSGGYVWISECCPQQFVSVFSGSIFEGSPHPPTTMLKLLYHWACHTSIQNVTQWVKVDNLYVKSFYTHLRAICTAAVHNKYMKLGGNRRKVQVGVISLGTTTQDGSTRQVKVEVLGVLDPESKHIRIRAIEPIQEGEKNYKKRFMKILEPLQHWVEKDSVILTDFTVDRGTLVKMGYTNVFQVSANDSTPSNKYSNHSIMEYLRKIVPRMFQNTLSLLSRAIIQQFLDELVWREMWGQIPSKAYESIIEHISEQTKLDTGGSLVNRLTKIAANPFKNWKYDRWAANCKLQPSPVPPPPAAPNFREEGTSSKALEAAPSLLPTIDNLPLTITEVEPSDVMSDGSVTRVEKAPGNLHPASIPLDPYYYGSLSGERHLQGLSSVFKVVCDMCGEEFNNNIQMMDHLIMHALNKNRSGDLKDICRLCLKVCPSQAALKTHHIQAHKDGLNTNQISCKICAVKMRDKAGLISHMTKTHYELEMPYLCNICKFRTSMWESMVKHFYEVHNGAECGLCPYCFKAIKFSINGKQITQNQYYYVMHIQKHQLSSLVRKCSRCYQWFINKSSQEDHEIAAHHSCKDLPGVERSDSETSTVLMPAPMTDPPAPPPASYRCSNKSRYLQNTSAFKASNFRVLRLTQLKGQTYFCHECEAPIKEDHFIGVLTCTKCQYQTCCQRAMTEHASSSHLSWTPRFLQGRPLRSTLGRLSCSQCSFSTTNLSSMAHHLAVDCTDGTCLIGGQRPDDAQPPGKRRKLNGEGEATP